MTSEHFTRCMQPDLTSLFGSSAINLIIRISMRELMEQDTLKRQLKNSMFVSESFLIKYNSCSGTGFGLAARYATLWALAVPPRLTNNTLLWIIQAAGRCTLLTSITKAIKAENPEGDAGMQYCKFLFNRIPFSLSASLLLGVPRVSGTPACPRNVLHGLPPLFLVIWLAGVLERPALIPLLSPFVHSCMHALNFNILPAATWLRLFPNCSYSIFLFFSFF